MPNKPLNLDESSEWAGMWWLPEAPHEIVPGVLRYDGAGGLSLTLIGAFEDRIMSHPSPGATAYSPGSRPWEVIHGTARQREITLLNATATSSRRTYGAAVQGPHEQTISADIAVIGAHVEGVEDPRFDALEVSIEDLGCWAGTSALEAFWGISEDKIDGTGSISVKPVGAQSVEVDNAEYCLVHTHTLPTLDHRKGETLGTVRDLVFLRVRLTESFPLHEALKKARLLQDLISLAAHHAAGIIWLRLELAGSCEQLSDGRVLPRYASVFYMPAALGSSQSEAMDPRNMFFTCDSLQFEDVLPVWCEIHDSLMAGINMILGLRYSSTPFVENNLLTVVGAAEVLHRNLRIGQTPFPKSEFKAMRAAMLTQVPNEHQDRFKAIIRNDLTLRDRLCDLASQLDPEVIALLMPDVDSWVTKTVRARNDLAHEGSTKHQSIEELLAIVDVTSAVVILNVLNELGLPVNRQRDVVSTHPKLSYAADRARRWLVN